MNYIQRFCLIRNGRISPLSLHSGMSITTAEEFVNELYNKLAPGYPRFHKMDMQSQLGFLAAEILFQDPGELRELNGDKMAVVLSNAEGSLHADIKYQKSVATAASPSLFVYTLPNIVAGEICIRHHIKGENAFFVTPVFDGELMVSYVNSLLDTQAADMCLAGWIDVTGDQHDVLLYLVSRIAHPNAIPHRAEELEKMYTQ